MKKYLVVLFVISLLFLSVHTTEASFFGDLWSGLFGSHSSVPAASLPANADVPSSTIQNSTTVSGTNSTVINKTTSVSAPTGTPIVSGNPVVCGKNTAPSITIVSPKGGETYQAGQQITVKWNSCNVPKDTRVGIAVDVNNPDYISSTELKMVPNVGSTVLTLPTASYDSNGNPYFLIGRRGTPSYKITPGKYFDIGIEAAIGSNTIGSASGLFTINAPVKQPQSVTVLSPNGGESYKVGDTIPITWKSTGFKSTDLVNVEVFSGGNVGLTDVVATSVPVTNNSFAWKIPTNFYSIEGKTYSVCVGNVGGAYSGTVNMNDCSDKTFTIAPNPCASGLEPSITVVSPDGGEVYQAGQQITVKWSSCNVVAKNVGIFLQVKDSAGDFPSNSTVIFPLSSSTINDGSEVVTLPTIDQYPSMQYGKNFKVFVTTDATGRSYSSYPFTINAPTIACTINSFTATPSTVQQGTSTNLSWTTGGCGSADFHWLFANGEVVDGGVTAKVQDSSVIPIGINTPLGIINVTMKACHSDLGLDPCVTKTITINVVSPAVATCTPTSVPSITVLSPNGGEVYQAGQVIVFKWKSCNVPSTALVAFDIKDNVIAEDWSIGGTLNDGIDGDEISPLMKLSGTHYSFTAYTKLDNGKIIADYSDGYFTINAPTTTTCTASGAPSITVLSPNGGEVYQESQQVAVKWTTCNISTDKAITVDLQVYDVNNKSLGNFGMTVQPSLNDGQQLVFLPTFASLKKANPTLFANVVPGAHFKILVSASNADHTEIAHDYSDDFFTINRAQS